jgi:transcriptional regulator with XRE-family HTH domain
VTKNYKPLEKIRKEAFTKAREKLGLSAKDLGGMACLSTRQIEQIENGETSSFYGAQIKVTAAKKVAGILKLSDEDAFDYDAQVPEKFNAAQVELPIAEARLVKTSKSDEARNVDAKQDADRVNKRVEETQLPVTVIAEDRNEPVAKVRVKEAPLAGAVTKSKSTSQKKTFIWLGVLATLVFSAINLRPLFFADKPEEIILVKEEVIEVAPSTLATPVEPAPIATPATVTAGSIIPADTPGVCPAEEGIVSYKPEAPRKPADLVYVQTKSTQTVCVIDASGKVQNKLLENGVGVSFYGKPPFKLLTTGLSQMDVFFQGAKVRLSNLNTKTLILEASEAITPLADRTDAQLR